MKPTVSLVSTYVNTAVSLWQLANYVYGVSPLPAGPPAIATELPGGVNTGRAVLSEMTDSYTEDFNLGYTRQLSDRTVFSADDTHLLGLNEPRSQQINFIEGPWNRIRGTFRLECGDSLAHYSASYVT